MMNSDPENTVPHDRAWFRGAALSEPCRAALAQAVADCQAEEATLWLLSSDGTQLEGVAHAGGSEHVLESFDVPVAQSLVGMVSQLGQSICVGPDAPYDRRVDQATALSTQAMVAAPVHAGQAVAGVVSAVRLHEGALFSIDDLHRLRNTARILGELIEGAAND